ncbi:hypothetical protein ACJENI_24825, partial [Escherichia coli]
IISQIIILFMQAESLTTQHHSTKQAANCREYLLLIYPQSGKNTNAHPRPGPIELASFEAKEVMEATIIRWMHRIL